MPLVEIDAILDARARIAGVALNTPLIPAVGLEVPGGNELYLKAENLQRTSSFKIRGAFNAIACLDEDQRSHGVITYSSGNHGQAVACAARLQGVRAVVVMPEDAIPIKIQLTRQWGAQVEFAGLTLLDRQNRALDMVAQHGYVVIPPFDHPDIIAGQGTAGLEILEQLLDVQAVLVPVGGGGLLAGIATAVKTMRPDVHIIGVEPEGAADARESLAGGEIVTWDHIETVADGLRTSRIGTLNFETVCEYVDDIVTVSDDEILWTVQTLATSCKLVVEPSGAAATAGVLFDRAGLRGKKVVAVVSGGNIEPSRLTAYLQMTQRPVPVTTRVE